MITLEQIRKDIEEIKQELNATDEELSRSVLFAMSNLWNFSSNKSFKEILKERINSTRYVLNLYTNLSDKDKQILRDKVKQECEKDKIMFNEGVMDTIFEKL